MEDKAIRALLELLPNEALAEINVAIAKDNLTEEMVNQLLVKYNISPQDIINKLEETK